MRERLAVIAEIKRRSPSKGDLNADLDPAELAAAYERGGAACLSVLTDVEHFGGSVADLQAARGGVLAARDPQGLHGQRASTCSTRGSWAPTACCSSPRRSTRRELAAFHRLAVDVGLDVLVEIHDEAELGHALAADATLIGVNQRDLVTFQVDHARAVRMAGVIPDRAVKVAESGVRGGR